MADLLSIKEASQWAGGKERLYLVDFEFICGEYEQSFNKVFYAKSESDLELKVEEYLKNYYGENNLSDIDNDVYYYWNEEVGIKFNGYFEIKNFEDLISKLL